MTKWNRLNDDDGDAFRGRRRDNKFSFFVVVGGCGQHKRGGSEKVFFSYFRFRAVERDSTVSWPKKLSPAMALYTTRYVFERELFFLKYILTKPSSFKKAMWHCWSKRTNESLILERRKLGHYKFFPRRKKSYSQKENEEGEGNQGCVKSSKSVRRGRRFFCSQRKKGTDGSRDCFWLPFPLISSPLRPSATTATARERVIDLILTRYGIWRKTSIFLRTQYQ